MTLQILMRPHADQSMYVRRVEVNGDGPVRINWEGLVRELKEEDPFPHYGITRERGVLQIEGLNGHNSFFLPVYWGRGFLRLTDTLPLWLSPEYLGSEKPLRLTLGLLHPGRTMQQTAPDDFFAKTSLFTSLFERTFDGNKIRDEKKYPDEEKKLLREFVRDFPLIQSLAKTSVELEVKKQKQKFAAKIIGNDYYHLVVLDDEQNPLVLSLLFFPEHVPLTFRKLFDFFKAEASFQIKQIN